MAKRPQLKQPGITATGRQWQTIDALRADGWLILEADPYLWSDEDAARVEAALSDRNAHRTPELDDPFRMAAISQMTKSNQGTGEK